MADDRGVILAHAAAALHVADVALRALADGEPWDASEALEVATQCQTVHAEIDALDLGRPPGTVALLPAENIALTVARAQLGRGENPPINTTTALVMALDRLTSIEREDRR